MFGHRRYLHLGSNGESGIFTVCLFLQFCFMSIICTYLIKKTCILTNMFLMHFMAVVIPYSLAHCFIGFLKSWKSLKNKKSCSHQTALRNSVGAFKGVGIRKMPNLHYISNGFGRLTSLFSFENAALKTQSYNSV